jgi:hypothetical protein
MKLILTSLATITAVMTLLVNAALAADLAAVATEAASNAVCPISADAEVSGSETARHIHDR